MDTTYAPADAAGSTPASPAFITTPYDVLGYRAVTHVEDGPGCAALSYVLAGFAVPSGAPAAEYRLSLHLGGWMARIGEDVFHTSPDLASAVAALEWRIITDGLARRPELFQLHGAAVCLPLRRGALLLAGDSGSGKTTLTLGLMLAGFVPFSDDVTLLDGESLTVEPLRRAFHTSPDTWDVLSAIAGGKLAPDAGAPEGFFAPPQWATRPVPVRAILFPEYRAGQTTSMTRLSLADSATAILGNTISLSVSPRFALSTGVRLAEQVPCYRFPMGDLGTAVAHVQRLSRDLL